MSQTHELSSYSDLKLLKKYPEDDFILTNDICPKEKPIDFIKNRVMEIIPGHYMYQPPEEFTGFLDGNGHKITHICLDGRGLLCNNKGVVKNLELRCYSYYQSEETTLTNTGHSEGCIAADNTGLISDCYVSVRKVDSASCFGGIVGRNNALIEDCHVEIEAKAGKSMTIGGIVGTNNGDIKNSSTSGEINGMGSTGGVVGHNNGTADTSNIQYCSSSCSINGNSRVGGVVGFNAANVEYCHFEGEIEGEIETGGLVGVNHQNGDISKSYVDCERFRVHKNSKSNILFGDNKGNIEDCFWTPTPGSDWEFTSIRKEEAPENVKQMDSVAEIEVNLAAINI